MPFIPANLFDAKPWRACIQAMLDRPGITFGNVDREAGGVNGEYFAFAVDDLLGPQSDPWAMAGYLNRVVFGLYDALDKALPAAMPDGLVCQIAELDFLNLRDGTAAIRGLLLHAPARKTVEVGVVPMEIPPAPKTWRDRPAMF